MTPDKWRLIDVGLHNCYHSLTDMCENVQIYFGERTNAVSVGYFLILSSPLKSSTRKAIKLTGNQIIAS